MQALIGVHVDATPLRAVVERRPCGTPHARLAGNSLGRAGQGAPRGRAPERSHGDQLRRGLAIGALALGMVLPLSPSLAGAAELAIVGARILPAPDAASIDSGTVIVRDGRIAAIGPRDTVRVHADAEVIDAAGLTLAAGFWNAHVHLLPDNLVGAASRPGAVLERELRELFTRWGFTVVFDIASQLDDGLALRRRIESGEIRGPRILTTGNPFYPAGGTPIYVREAYRRHGFASDEVDSPAQARERASGQLARGADGIKVFTGAIVGGAEGVRPMRSEVAAAAIEPALAAGKPAFAHPTDPRGIRLALDAGVTVLAHTTPTTGPWPDDLVREIAERRVALIPTLMLLELYLAEENVPAPLRERMMGAAQQQVRALAAAGGEILFGTDVGFIQEADPTSEYRLLAGAGLDYRAILRALTTAPAARFDGGRGTGRVAVGEPADLVLLGGDPAASVDAFSDVRFTIRAGRVIYRSN